MSLTTTSRTLNEGIAAHLLPATANTTSSATASNVAIIDAFVHANADGYVTPQFSSEIASSAITAKRGSFVEYAAV